MNAGGSELFFPTRERRTQTSTLAPCATREQRCPTELSAVMGTFHISATHSGQLSVRNMASATKGLNFYCILINVHLNLSSHVQLGAMLLDKELYRMFICFSGVTGPAHH